MPIYEYVCAECSHQFEDIQSISSDPIQPCPSCSKVAAQRQVSQSAFHLKGGGWYKEGYASGGSSSSSDSSSASSTS